MSEANLWKIVERLESITENLEDINDYLDQIHDTNMAFNQWIQQATENILSIQKDVTFLKHKKTCI